MIKSFPRFECQNDWFQVHNQLYIIKRSYNMAQLAWTGLYSGRMPVCRAEAHVKIRPINYILCLKIIMLRLSSGQAGIHIFNNVCLSLVFVEEHRDATIQNKEKNNVNWNSFYYGELHVFTFKRTVELINYREKSCQHNLISSPNHSIN